MFLFDTDIVSYAISRRPPVPLAKRLARAPAEQQFTTSITLSELIAGAHRCRREIRRSDGESHAVVVLRLQ